MGQFQNLEAWTGMPWVLTLMVCMVMAVWFWQRKHTYLLWLAVSLFMLDAAFVLKEANQTWHSYIGAVYLFGIAAWALAQAMAQRHGQQIKAQWAVVGTVLVASGSWLLSAQVYLTVVALALAAVLAHVLPHVMSSTPRHNADRFLRFFYGVVVLLVAASPWLLRNEWDTEGRASALAFLCSAVLVIAMLACPFCDAWMMARLKHHRDGLTGLLSEAGLQAVCSASPAEQNITALVICELDDFPHYQQHCGIQHIHVVLCQLGQMLQGAVQKTDHVARLNGGTFVVALHNSNAEQAQALVEQLREKMKNFSWISKKASHPVTATFAFVSVSQADTFEMLMHRAEVLLCQAREDRASGVELDCVGVC